MRHARCESQAANTTNVVRDVVVAAAELVRSERTLGNAVEGLFLDSNDDDDDDNSAGKSLCLRAVHVIIQARKTPTNRQTCNRNRSISITCVMCVCWLGGAAMHYIYIDSMHNCCVVCVVNKIHSALCAS